MTSVFQLVWDCWENHVKEHPQYEAIVHWDALGKPFRWTYGNLLEEALKIADNLMHQGVKAGDVCALILRHNKYFYPIYMGIAAIGAIPAVLAYPNVRLHPAKFFHGLSGMAQKSGLDWVMTERELELSIKPLIINEQSTIKGIFFPLEWINSQQPKELKYELINKSRNTINSSAPFLLQHSSGTTGLQKAVVLSHKAVLEHIKRYSKAIKLSEEDKIVNWLPLYHDMGLIAAFHIPLALGIPSIQLDPFQWVSAPIILFQAISEEKATLTWLPNFAYNFLADRVDEEEMEGIDLSSMRMFVNCSEVVRSESHKKFFNRFQKYGVKKESLAACYAMAETTFAVTQTEPGFEARMLTVDRNALARKIVQPPQYAGLEKICVSSGKPISDCLLKIIDENGVELPENRVGKVFIKSISLFDGYRNKPETTSQVLKDGWYSSGDIGFLHNGEYFIIGRGDDVIIVAGKNIFPEDIEDVVNNVKGVIPGRIVAFGVENLETGTEDVAVIAETSCEDAIEKNPLELTIKQAGMDIDVTISVVYLVPPRWLIKSSSGKPSRKANKERILVNNVDLIKK
jgi:acyl-CoA synthetase (AMP-forming)/AMP-acid ligase II